MCVYASSSSLLSFSRSVSWLARSLAHRSLSLFISSFIALRAHPLRSRAINISALRALALIARSSGPSFMSARSLYAHRISLSSRCRSTLSLALRARCRSSRALAPLISCPSIARSSLCSSHRRNICRSLSALSLLPSHVLSSSFSLALARSLSLSLAVAPAPLSRCCIAPFLLPRCSHHHASSPLPSSVARSRAHRALIWPLYFLAKPRALSSLSRSASFIRALLSSLAHLALAPSCIYARSSVLALSFVIAHHRSPRAPSRSPNRSLAVFLLAPSNRALAISLIARSLIALWPRSRALSCAARALAAAAVRASRIAPSRRSVALPRALLPRSLSLSRCARSRSLCLAAAPPSFARALALALAVSLAIALSLALALSISSSVLARSLSRSRSCCRLLPSFIALLLPSFMCRSLIFLAHRSVLPFL